MQQNLDFSEINDIDLTENIKNDFMTNESLKELVSRHSGIYFKMVNRYVPNKQDIHKKDHVERESLIDEKDFFIYEMAKKYDPYRGVKFSTFLGSQARFKCLNEINDRRELEYVDSDTLNFYSDKNFNENFYDNSNNEELIDKVIETLESFHDKRARKIIEERYFTATNGKLKTWNNVSKKIKKDKNGEKHLSYQGVINIHNDAIEYLKGELSKIEEEV